MDPITLSVVPQAKVHIGRVIQNAVVFDPGYPMERAVDAAALPETVARFFAVLERRQIDYTLVGGIALLQYVEGRNTEDIDLIMALASLNALPEIEVTGEDIDFVRGTFDGLQIDVLLTRNPVFDKVRRRYTTRRRFVERDIPCATVEGLLLLKLFALPSMYRQGSFARVSIYENDIATLMQAYRPDIAPLLEDLQPHLSVADLAAVQEIVTEIQARIARFGAGR